MIFFNYFCALILLVGVLMPNNHLFADKNLKLLTRMIRQHP